DTQSFIVHDVVEEAIRLVKLTHDGRQIRFINNCDSAWSIEGDRQAISQVLVNLLTNACHASTPGSSVEIKADEIGDLIRLQVVDQGEGISEENLGYLFEPFFTTKAPGEGTGLGLAIAYKIVSDHKGAITIDSDQGEGTRVIMDLPRTFHDKVV
ncbi:MAG: HAMP domain-containing histidine kinase, partial [Candidatus Thiodiazotropha taylori]|nr:HAMP domain-containing histidine kinase [Candidatus Thiodiazotropha taylori]